MYKTGTYEMPYTLPTAEESRMKGDLVSSKVLAAPEKTKPPLPVALLFPGQGSQYLGMLKDHYDRPRVQEMLATAETILGWNVSDLCKNGPEEKLSQTKYCQPVMFIAGMVAYELVKETKPDIAERPQAVAGLSLGEFTALCVAGILDFEQTLKLVKLRAEAMQDATELVPQSMCSVAGLDRPTVERLCKEENDNDKKVENPICQIANHLFPSGYVCAGHKSTIDQLCKLATDARALQARPIKAGGAFHSPLMNTARDRFVQTVDMSLSDMRPPRCSIYFNQNGKKYAAGTDPAEFVDCIRQQIISEVLWEPLIKNMILDGVKEFYECGPLKQLKAMIKRIDQEAFKHTENISV